jgi:histidyl-tRNA synthetase
MIKAIRGTRDLLPPDTALWNFVEDKVRQLFRAYNFQEIRTPIFEETQLFARSVGEETDIVAKEMYTWEDRGQKFLPPGAINEFDAMTYRNLMTAQAFLNSLRNSIDEGKLALDGHKKSVFNRVVGSFNVAQDLSKRYHSGATTDTEVVGTAVAEVVKGMSELIKSLLLPLERDKTQSLTLRPENTAGVVRAYIEHKLWDRGLNKLYYIGPQFRRERPQKGRYRQFYQIGAEMIGPPPSGSESPARDAELLELLATLLDRLGIKGWQLQLNSIGCADDRARYNEALRKALDPVAPKMCADCQRRAVTNPLRVFDCKVPEDQPIIEKLPRISQYLDEPCRKHFQEVQEILKAVGVPFTLNDRLVRGLDYYTRTAFEFTHGALGAQNAILGGGRYDGLSESLGGPKAPGIGFAIGEDRLVLALQQSAEAVQPKPDVYIAPLGAGMDREAARLARELRQHDIIVELGDENFRLKKSFEIASKVGARFILIVGENEAKSQAFALKNLESGEQISVPGAELAQKFNSPKI